MNDKDKPWTADDIRKNATNWSLLGDGKLLEFMQGISKTLEERGNHTTQNMHKMMLDLDKTKIALENTTNQLMALQHSQFVENRVYDDDETLANIDNVPVEDPKQGTEKKTSIFDALENALETGLKMMDKYYDKVTYELSDSDDDDDQEGSHKSVIYRPRDPYHSRPLPYLIGSKEWLEKWHIGLVDSEAEENTEDENADQLSKSSSSSSTVSLSTNMPESISDSEHSTSDHVSAASDRQKAVTQDLFKSVPGEVALQKPRQSFAENSAVPPLSVNIENSLVPKIEENIQHIDRGEFSATNSIFCVQRQPDILHVNAKLIDSEPPELDESSAVQTKNRKPVNLFLDDESDDDFNIFGEPKVVSNNEKAISIDRNSLQRNINKMPAANQTNTINLFGDNDDVDHFDSFMSTKAKVTLGKNSNKLEDKIKNLFEDDDDEEDELFLQPPEPIEKKPPAKATILSNAPEKNAFFQTLFDDQPPEDDFEIFTKSDKVTSDPIAADRKMEQIKQNGLAKDSDRIEPHQIIAIVSNKSVKKINLFDNDDDDEKDDSFENLIKSCSKAKETSRTDHIEPKLLAKSENEPRKSSILSSVENEISEENEQFVKVTQPKVVPDQSQGSRKTKDLPTINNYTLNYSSVSLFDDLPPDDIGDDFISNILPESIAQKSNPMQLHTHKQPGEFYNDFSETITNTENASANPKSLSSSVLLSENTTPNDFNLNDPKSNHPKTFVKPFSDSKPSCVEDATHMAQKRSEFAKKLNVFAKTEDLSSVKATIAESTNEKTAQNQPKKLNIASFDKINVAALLPGAKRIKAEAEIEVENSEQINSEKLQNEIEVHSSSIAKAVSVDNVDSSGRLGNLNRNRVKGLSRRPSTRVGRQLQYQKTLKEEEEADNATTSCNENRNKIKNSKNLVTNKISFIPKTIETKPVVSSHNKEAMASVNNPESRTAIETAAHGEKEEIKDDKNSSKFSIVSAKEPHNPVFSDAEESSDSLFDVKSDEKQSKENPSTNANKLNSLSFLDENDNEDDIDDWLANIIVNKPSPVQNKSAEIPTTKSLKITPKFFDELPPELDVQDEKSNFSTHIRDSDGPSKAPTSMFSKNVTNLFGDDDDDYDDEGIFASTEPPPIPTTTENNKNQRFDGESEHDDWNSYPVTNTPAQQTFQSTLTSAGTFIDKSPPFLTHASSLLKSSDKNFDDFDANRKSEKASNDPSNHEPVRKPASLNTLKKTTSIFGENSDEDDLFGTSPSVLVTEPAKQQKQLIISKKSANPSLFSDDDDESDDDLFGSIGKKQENKSSAVKRVADIKLSQNTTSLPSALSTSATVLNSKSLAGKLFGDSEEDDDDDLFGTKRKPTASASMKKNSISGSPVTTAIASQTKTKIKATPPSNLADNDPLADLLK